MNSNNNHNNKFIGSLSVNAKLTLLQVFTSSRLDYCNSLLADITSDQMKHLQSVQNAAARLVTGAARHVHTPVSCVNCTGCPFTNEFSSSLPPSSISRCPVLLLITWPMTVNSSSTSEPVSFTLPTPERV